MSPAADEGPSPRVKSVRANPNPHIQPPADATVMQAAAAAAAAGGAGGSGSTGNGEVVRSGRQGQQQHHQQPDRDRGSIAEAIAARVQDGWRLLNATCEYLA